MNITSKIDTLILGCEAMIELADATRDFVLHYTMPGDGYIAASKLELVVEHLKNAKLAAEKSKETL